MFRLLHLVCLAVALSLYGAGVAGHYPHDDVRFLALSPDFGNDQTLVAAQRQGSSILPQVPLVTSDGGIEWRFGPAGVDNVADFSGAAVSPDFPTDRTILFSNSQSGILRSQDAGASWHHVGSSLPTQKLGPIIATHAPTGIAYFVAGLDGALFRSDDDGDSWATVLGSGDIFKAIAVSPDFSGDGVIIAADELSVVYLSTNGGTSFTSVNVPAAMGEVFDFAFPPDFATRPEILAATATGLYRSTDGGLSFTAVPFFAQDFVTTAAYSPNYAADGRLLVGTATLLYGSQDEGGTWSALDVITEYSGQSQVHFFDVHFSNTFSSDGTVLVGTFEGVFRSDDAGATWRELDSRPNSLLLGVGLSPNFANDQKMLVASYGAGLYVSDDGGGTWRINNTGVDSVYTYIATITPGDESERLWVSANGGKLLISDNEGVSWSGSPVTTPDIATCVPSDIALSPDFLNDGSLLAACRKLGLAVSTDFGQTWQTILSGADTGNEIVATVSVSPNVKSDGIMFFATSKGAFARSTDSGKTWQQIQNGLPGTGPWFGGNRVAVSPDFANDQMLLASTIAGLYVSHDAGDTWSPADTAGSALAGVIEYVAFSPDFAQDGTVFTDVRGTGLFRSTDFGVTWVAVGADLAATGEELKKFVLSPQFPQDQTIVGVSHDRLFMSVDAGISFNGLDIPTVRHEERRTQSIRYDGGWKAVDDGSASGTRFSVSTAAGNEASIEFSGSGIAWLGPRAPSLGQAEVYLDGLLQAAVDQYSPHIIHQGILFLRTNLTVGPHTLTIRSTGTGHPASTGDAIALDAFDVIR